MERPYPVKYVLYTHYSHREGVDFTAWTAGTPCARLEGVRFLTEHLHGLLELLTSPAHEGILVIFYAVGFADCLDGIAAGKRREELLSGNAQVRFAASVGEHIADLLGTDPELANRVRFVTPIDLYDIFGRMNWDIAKDLRWWFIGEAASIRYDTPKIVEAFVRLRLLGTGVPVLRLDYDVLFRGDENKSLPDLGLFKPVASCLRAYQLRVAEPSVATFLFSASYDARELLTAQNGNFQAWSRAFATRIFPCLPVVPNELAKIDTSHVGQVYTWDSYASAVFDAALARQFYGLAQDRLASEDVSGIGRIGAHPTASVISGALLCLSDGAILDLPPFSNFTLNVSWIDDHLKYSLHRELRHLTTVELKVEPLLSDAKLDAIMVQKSRARINDLPAYVLGQYLPTLLWGTVVDAWINADPLVKYRPEDLDGDARDAWHRIRRTGRSEATLASALQMALEKGSFTNAERIAVRAQLVKTGLQRMTEVRREWSRLSVGATETFASIWAKGLTSRYFPTLDGKCCGIADIGMPVDAPLNSVVELNRHLHDDFLTLVNDALEYIEWALNWPRIVQVVRSVEQGTVHTDVSWRPHRARRVDSSAVPSPTLV